MRQRADLLMAVSVPVLLVAGLLPWQRDRMCTAAGCGTVRATAWTGSYAWTLPLLTGLLLAGLWVLLLPGRPRVPTAVAALTGTVAVLAAAVLVATLDAVVFGRAGVFRFELPVRAEFPVLSVRPAEGLGFGLAGLLLQAAAGWSTLRHRGLTQGPPRRRAARPTPDRRGAPARPGGPDRPRHLPGGVPPAAR